MPAAPMGIWGAGVYLTVAPASGRAMREAFNRLNTREASRSRHPQWCAARDEACFLSRGGSHVPAARCLPRGDIADLFADVVQVEDFFPAFLEQHGLRSLADFVGGV